MSKLLTELRRYFLDTEPKKLNFKRHRNFIIERILEYGDEGAIRWLRKTFGDEAIDEKNFISLTKAVLLCT